MDSMSYILFICVASPILLMLLPIEKQSRKVVLFMLTGMFCCLFISEVNGLILRLSDMSLLYFTTNITPITEEIIKALPVLFFAVVFSDNKKDIITASFSVGVGFAILENLIILTQNFRDVNIWFAIARGFCSGLMHSICTIAVGCFIVFVRKKKKIFITGSISALNIAIIYHSVFNLLVQANSVTAQHVGLAIPFLTYAVLNISIIVKYKNKKTST